MGENIHFISSHSCRSPVMLKYESQVNKEEVCFVFLSPTQSGKVYISVFAQLLPAQSVPWCSRLMLAAAVMVSQTLRSKVSCWPPQTDSHLTGRKVRCQELGWHRVVFTEFFTVSASSMFYCSFPEFKWGFFSCQTTLNTLFYSQKTISSPIWRLFTQPDEVPTGPGRVLTSLFT